MYIAGIHEEITSKEYKNTYKNTVKVPCNRTEDPEGR
jgi:hypothetical protein